MFCLVNCIRLVCFFVVLTSSVLAETASVLTKYGAIDGIHEQSLNGKTFHSFLGIPYAKAPVGNLRFENPAEIDPWPGTFPAIEMPSACPQFDLISLYVMPTAEQYGSEDCLYLNVYTPKVSSSASLAVMVFIHGGGYTNGGANEYGPYVLMDEDVVLVVIQYRLSVFGFLSTGDDLIPGNLGLKDQSFALKWVRENIEEFGGDKNRVTIFGESAGAGSVHFHILSPLSKGLFQRAIMQSGSSLCPWSTVTNQRDFAEQLALATDCPLDRSDYKECLKKTDSSILMGALKKSFKYGMQPILTSPTVDGEFLLEEPLTLLKKKKYNKVNVISGITRNEGGFFTALVFAGVNTLKGLKSNFAEYAPTSLFIDSEQNGETLAQTAYDSYLGGKPFEESADELTELLGDRIINVCHDLTSMFMAEDEDLDLYRYEFVHRGKKSAMDLFQMDTQKKYVVHVDDLIYLFHGGPILGPLSISSAEDLKMRNIFVKLWIKFARTGHPSSDELGFDWPATTAASKLNYLGLELQSKMMNDSRQKIRDFWFSLDTNQNRQLFADGYDNVLLQRKSNIKEEL